MVCPILGGNKYGRKKGFGHRKGKTKERYAAGGRLGLCFWGAFVNWEG